MPGPGGPGQSTAAQQLDVVAVRGDREKVDL
jgi:hypothetical protein